MKKYFILLICFLSIGCSTLSKEERLALEAKIDHEECLNLGFEENTEAYGGCRLTLKSIRAQDNTTVQNHVLGAQVKTITDADDNLIEVGDDFGFDGSVF